MLEIRDIRIEGKIGEAFGDNTSPELSFALFSDIPDTYLASAIVKVGDFELDCGSEQLGIYLSNLPLSPFSSYAIKITAKDNHGQTATSSAVYKTGKLGGAWSAKWITDRSCHTDKGASPKPMTFKRDFARQGKVKRAYIASSAIGIYDLYLNGELISERYFAPGFTSYKHILKYQYYDVTDLLSAENSLMAIVASGWATGRFTYESKSQITAKRQALLLELTIEYESGKTETIVTDESFLVTSEGPYISADFYDGEHFDARASYDGAVFKAADVIKPPTKAVLVADTDGGVVKHEKMNAKLVGKSRSGELIYDFGQNFAGVVDLKIKGKAGQTVTVRHAEVLDGDELYVKSLRSAKQTITYVCREGEQHYSPRFTYMGFRYVGISGIDAENIDLSAYALYSDITEVGRFCCSDERLNKLQNSILWSAKSNFVDIPTDCPQRDERQGWTGDISVFASTACYNFDMSAFLEKWLRDMRCEQGFGGGIPMVIPRHGSTPPVVATACWGDSCIIVPYAEFMARGNKRLLERQYPAMKKFMGAVKFWASLSGFGDRRYIWKWLFQFGDWCAPDGYIKDWMARGKWIATAYYANSCALMAKIAHVLGHFDDEKHFSDLKERICTAYRNILTDGHGKIKNEFQSAYVLPLYFEMEKGDNRREMAKNLDRLVRENDYRIGTGFPATPYILFALADNGYADTAFKLLTNEECPSWLYEVKMGGTTFWEQWSSILPDGTVRDPSLNHYAYGAVGDFLYKRVLGLEPLCEGYRLFSVKPTYFCKLKWAKGRYNSPYGEICVEWKNENSVFEIAISVPPSTTCALVLPSGKAMRLGSGEHIINEEIKEVK